MFHRAYALFLLIAAAAAQAMPSLTVDEVTYSNVTLKKEYPRSLFIKHDGGTAFIERSALSEEQIAELLGGTGEAVVAGKAVAQPGAEDDYRKAKDFLKQEDNGTNWTQAVELMRKAAEAGHPTAQYEWGMFLIDSFCVKQDVKKGEEFLRRAADAGNGGALRELANTEKDSAKFADAVKKAAEAGDGRAMVFQAAILLNKSSGEQSESRALLEKVFASGNAEAMTEAGRLYEFWARNPKALQQLGMTKEEMDTRAMEGLRAGCKEKVLTAYPLLAGRLREDLDTDKNEEESKALMAEFKRIAEQKIAKGSISAQFALMEWLHAGQAATEDEEILRIATSVLASSNYPWHHMIAALSGARIVEKKEPDNAEGLRSALDWLKERQTEIGGDSLQGFISSYEKKLADASSKAAGQ